MSAAPKTWASTATWIVVQIILAGLTVGIMYAIVASVTKTTRLVVTDLHHEQTLNVKMVDEPVNSRRVYATIPDASAMSVNGVFNLQPSYNRKGGDQFTIALKLRADTSLRKSGTLLLWGDSSYTTFQAVESDREVHHLVTMMPHIAYEVEPDNVSFTVTYNTTDKINETMRFRTNTGGRVVDYATGFYLVLTFRDNDLGTEQADGCIAQAFVDQNVVSSQTSRGSIKRNRGYFYLFPGAPLTRQAESSNKSEMRVLQCTYHNYAFRVKDTKRLMNGDLKYASSLTDGSESGKYDKVNDLTIHHLRTSYS